MAKQHSPVREEYEVVIERLTRLREGVQSGAISPGKIAAKLAPITQYVITEDVSYTQRMADVRAQVKAYEEEAARAQSPSPRLTARTTERIVRILHALERYVRECADRLPPDAPLKITLAPTAAAQEDASTLEITLQPRAEPSGPLAAENAALRRTLAQAHRALTALQQQLNTCQQQLAAVTAQHAAELAETRREMDALAAQLAEVQAQATAPEPAKPMTDAATQALDKFLLEEVFNDQ